MTRILHPVYGTGLPADWILRTVDDVKAPEPSSCVAGPFGSNIASKYFVEEGVPVIRGSNLTDDLTPFVADGFVFVSMDRAEHYRPQHVRPGDLVFTCWGTIGQVGRIPEGGPFPEYIISNKQLKLRPNPAMVDSRFLFYYFASPAMVQYIRNRAVGSAIPGINLGILKSLPVVLPPLPVQRRIASILSAYDDLIENNTRRIAILEEMAAAIYREWFVEFRFPGYEGVPMVDSELGPIPEGWTTCPLGDIALLVARGVSPKYVEGATGRVLNQKCIRDGRLSLEPSRRHETSVPQSKLLRLGDVLINSTGTGTLGRVAQVLGALADTTVDSHVTIVRPDTTKVTCEYIGLNLLSRESEFAGMATGSTGQTELSRSRIAETTILLPAIQHQKEYSRVVSPIQALTTNLRAQSTNLRQTRDLLLPRLISGEIDASNLEIGDAEPAA